MKTLDGMVDEEGCIELDEDRTPYRLLSRDHFIVLTRMLIRIPVVLRAVEVLADDRIILPNRYEAFLCLLLIKYSCGSERKFPYASPHCHFLFMSIIFNMHSLSTMMIHITILL